MAEQSSCALAALISCRPGEIDETCTSQLLASGGDCRCVAGRIAARFGANVPVAASTHRRRLCGWRVAGYHCAFDSSIAFEPFWSAIHRRQSAGRGHQYCNRGGRACAPDGYTLLWVTAPNAINATLYDKLNFNFVRDIPPVAPIVRLPNVMVVNPSVPAKTVPEFIAYAKANPGRINMACSTVGGTDHVSGELFKMMAGIDLVLVPYRGGGAALFSDLFGGVVQVNFPSLASVIGYVRGEKLRALAVTTTTRSDAMPEIPTVGEFLPGYEASSWHGVGVPKSTPVEIIDKLNYQINRALADPLLKARLAELGGMALGGSPAEFGKLIADETEKWGNVVKFAGLRPE